MSFEEHDQQRLPIERPAITARFRRLQAEMVARQHLKTRYSCTPDTMPPELHETIAHWLRLIGRAGGGRDQRTQEAILTIGLMTDWHEWDIRRAMTIVAKHLSPGEGSS